MPDNYPEVTFVNALEVNGHVNGVVNLLFSVATFTPIGDKVDVGKELVLDLRFDLFCAQAVHDALAKILAENTKKPRMDS